MQFRTIVIDDDESTVRLLTFILRERGHEVISLSDPSACPSFSRVQCLCPQEHACGDFLIIDHHIAGMTGLEFIQRQVLGGCRGVAANKAVLSGLWTPEELERARSLGCRIFRKPFLVREIYEWLDEREGTIDRNRQLSSLPDGMVAPGDPLQNP